MESFIPLSMLNTFELKVSQLTCLDMGVCYSDFNVLTSLPYFGVKLRKK